MKKFISKINSKINGMAIKAKCAIENKKAEMYVDKGVGIIIAVVVGALILGGIYALIKSVLGTATTNVTDMFNFKG